MVHSGAAVSRATNSVASIAAIAVAAEGSEALVYKYFTGKADLYAQVLRNTVDAFAAPS